MSEDRRRPLDPNVVALGLASLLHDVASEIAFPFLPAFVTTVLGGAPTALGLIEGAADSASSLLKPVFGALSDRAGRRKPLVVAGYAIANLARPFLAVAAAPWHVLAVRLADRAGKGVRTAPRDALLADSTDPADRGRAFGFHRAADHVGAVVGPLVGMALFVAVGRNLRWLFALAAVPGLAAVAFTAVRVREVAAAAGTKRGQSPFSRGSASQDESGDSPLDPRFATFLAAVFLFTLGNSSDAFLLLRLERAGVDVAWLPVLWSALHVVKVATVYGFGALSDRLGRRRLIVAGWIYYAAVYVGLALADRPETVVAVFLAYGVFHGLTEGVERALVGDLVPAERRGAAYGLYNAAIGVGALPASVVMGALWQAYGHAAGFFFGAAMATIGAALLLAVPLRRR